MVIEEVHFPSWIESATVKIIHWIVWKDIYDDEDTTNDHWWKLLRQQEPCHEDRLWRNLALQHQGRSKLKNDINLWEEGDI